jgi:hypothetical protein
MDPTSSSPELDPLDNSVYTILHLLISLIILSQEFLAT